MVIEDSMEINLLNGKHSKRNNPIEKTGELRNMKMEKIQFSPSASGEEVTIKRDRMGDLKLPEIINLSRNMGSD